MLSDVHIGYAIRDAAVVHISEVPFGLACGCVCARCGERLIAKKGSRRAHHFAHDRDTDCPGGLETLVHLLGKEIYASAPVIILPAYVYKGRFTPRGGARVEIDRQVFPPTRFQVTECVVERGLGPIVPDLILSSGEERLLVEITVTHPVDKVKLRRVRRLNIPLLEVRLGRQDMLLPRAALAKRLIDDLSIKSWLFLPAQRAVEAEWVRVRRKAIADARAIRRTQLHHLPKERAALPTRANVLLDNRQRADWHRGGASNAWAERFARAHGRYPTLDEVRAHAARERRH